jgi:hypothetical protein
MCYEWLRTLLNIVNQPVEVMRGRHGQEQLFGPLPGVRRGDVLAYEFELPDSFVPWPGRTLLERTVEQRQDTYIIRDLFIDVVVPMDGRHYRMLDLDEFADAILPLLELRPFGVPVRWT